MSPRTATLVALFLLTACAPQDESFPTADAGFAQTGDAQQEHSFDGSASSGEALSYAWTLSALPLGSALTDADLLYADTPWPSLTPDLDGLYVLDLEVCDVQGRCDWSQTELQVGSHPHSTQKPMALGSGLFPKGSGNQAPVAIATFGASWQGAVLLNGEESYDPEGEQLTWSWTLVSAPEGSQLTQDDIQNASSDLASFYPDVKGTYKMRLKVSDGRKWASKFLSGTVIRIVDDPDPVD